jgi:hypothetical protein
MLLLHELENKERKAKWMENTTKNLLKNDRPTLIDQATSSQGRNGDTEKLKRKGVCGGT